MTTEMQSPFLETGTVRTETVAPPVIGTLVFGLPIRGIRTTFGKCLVLIGDNNSDWKPWPLTK